MKSVQLADVAALADEVKRGEAIDIRDGETIVARVVPIGSQPLEARIDELVAQGKARRGTGVLPEWFFSDRLPKFESGSVLEQLLNDRHSGLVSHAD